MASEQLSKTVAHALRHDPSAYGLELDAEGWVPLESLVEALHSRSRWSSVTAADLQEMVDTASKKRYEIRDGRIRAFYEHSTPTKIARDATEPPVELFHGTSPAAARLILRDGLRPMGRQFVHMSADRATARAVGARKAGRPVLLVVDARAAHAAGVAFYLGNDKVWLADDVPPQFIRPDAAEPPDRAHAG